MKRHAPPGPFLGQPAGLATLFFTEMWERASYYGMRGLLILFLVARVQQGGFGFDDRTAAAVYGLYTASTYLVGLPGGALADRWLGAQRAVLLGGLGIAAGHLTLGLARTHATFYLGLAVIVLGTGLLKPNASAMVSQLYPEGGSRRDAGYTTYYLGINLGAMIGPLVTGWLAQRYGWPAGFMAAAVGMALGVAQFQRGRRLLGEAGRAPRAAADAPGTGRGAKGPATSLHAAGAALAIAIAIAIAALALAARARLGATTPYPSPAQLQRFAQGTIALVALGYFGYLFGFARLAGAERRRIAVAAVLFIASVLFWAGYEQAGSSLNLFAERYTDLRLLGHPVPAVWLQSLEGIFVIAFAPAFSALWMVLGRRHLDPSAPLKFVFGLAGIALGFLVMAAAARQVTHGALVGMSWLTVTYLLHTWGELALSPIGMSAFSKLVPSRMAGRGLGLWFVSLSLGDLLASRIAGSFDATRIATLPGNFLLTFQLVGGCALLLLLLWPLLRRWSTGAL